MHPLSALIKALGSSQREIGLELGLSQARISEICNGDTMTSETALLVMELHGKRLRRLGFGLEDLLRGKAA